mmetsp:Transcript_81043/g.212769  ORF Transcript_81043/g.212769 Transcript_81043/m.212769 type:complete len:499 (-) Transcript_81043:21-1517(-)
MDRQKLAGDGRMAHSARKPTCTRQVSSLGLLLLLLGGLLLLLIVILALLPPLGRLGHLLVLALVHLRQVAPPALSQEPRPGRLLVRPALLSELAGEDELLLVAGAGAKAPPHVVRVALHDHALDHGDHAVVDRGDHRRGHLRHARRDGLALGGHHDNLRADLDVLLKAQHARDHELGAVADGVDSAVLDHNARVRGEDELEGHDHAPQVLLVAHVVVHVLRVQHVVHGAHELVLVEDARAHAAKLLHVGPDAQHQAQVNAHRTDVRARLAVDVEDSHVPLLVVLHQLRLVDRADAQLALHRRDHRRPLEEGPRELVEGLLHLGSAAGVRVEAGDGHVLLSGRLLSLDEARGAVQAHKQAPGDLGIERAGVAGLLAVHDALDPGHHLVGGGVDRLVQVQDAVEAVGIKGPAQGRAAVGQGRVVARAHEQLPVVLQEQRPLRGVDGGGILRLDEQLARHGVVALLHRLHLLLLLSHVGEETLSMKTSDQKGPAASGRAAA